MAGKKHQGFIHFLILLPDDSTNNICLYIWRKVIAVFTISVIKVIIMNRI